MIKGFKAGQQSLAEVYKSPPEEELACWECDSNVLSCDCEAADKADQLEELELNSEGKAWDYFEGCDQSRLFGVYTHCQCNEAEKLHVMETHRVLLQFGENGFNDEGVFNVLIPAED